jgi:hypothetical protein
MPFEIEHGRWRAHATLASWAGFQARRRPDASRGTQRLSDGSVVIVLAGLPAMAPPAKDALDRVAWLLDHEREVSGALLRGLLAQYARLQTAYDCEPPERDRLMPAVRSPEDFRPLIGLRAVHVHPLTKDGIPYLGFELDCTWDDEHGLGVLMHGTRVVEIGEADTAILLWIAERDAAEGARGASPPPGT